MKTITINAAQAAQLILNDWVIINGEFLVGIYGSRTAARTAKSENKFEGQILKASEVAFEEVQQVKASPVVLGAPLSDPTEAANQPKVDPLDLGAALKAQHAGAKQSRQPVHRSEELINKTTITHESVIEHPCKQVWNIATDMKEDNPAVKRGAVLAACVAAGIAYYTARTQYQQWLTVQKEMAEREAAQAK